MTLKTEMRAIAKLLASAAGQMHMQIAKQVVMPDMFEAALASVREAQIRLDALADTINLPRR